MEMRARPSSRPAAAAVAAIAILVFSACSEIAAPPTASAPPAQPVTSGAPSVQDATPGHDMAPPPGSAIAWGPHIAGEREGWPGIAFVAGGESNKMWVLDAKYHKLLTTIDMGGPRVERTKPERYPNLQDDHALVFTKDFSALFTVVSWEYGQSYAIKLDPKTFRELGRAPAGEGGHHAALSPDDKFLYVANEYSTVVSVIDPKTMTKIADLEVGDGADYISPSMYWAGKPIDSPYLFVSVDKENKVAVIDWRKNEVVKSIPVNGRLHGVNLTPDGKQVWVAVGGAKEAAIIDVASLTVIKTLPIFDKGGPTHIVFSPDGKSAYITGGGQLYKIDTQTYEQKWVVRGAGAHLGVSPDGREAWTLNHTIDPPDRYPYLLGGAKLSATRVFATDDGQFIAEMPAEYRPHEIQFVPFEAIGIAPLPTPQPGAVAVPATMRQVTLTAKNDVYQPGSITAKPGEKLQFVVVNQDGYGHVLGSENAKMPVAPIQGDGRTTVEWTVTVPPGKYLLECIVHPGMQLDLIVQ